MSALQRFQALGRLKPGRMNGTEADYASLLEMRKRVGEIAWYAFEPFKIRLANRTFYDVDFGVMLADGRLEIHEVKGGFVTDDGWAKVKMAAEIFPAQFYLCQKIKKAWKIDVV